MTNINLNPTKSVTNGGRGVIVRVPSRIKFYFSYKDTMGKILGFRNVGQDTSITDFNSVINNFDPYLDEISYDINGNEISIRQNAINLKKFSYFYILCDELPIITNINNITNILAKVIITDNALLIDTFSISPSFYYDPIRELYQLTLQFVFPDGDLVNFDGLDHNFLLEITTFDNIPELTNITTNITIDK